MKSAVFAKKYGVNPTLVYSASFNTPTRKRTRSRDIPEDELKVATINELKRRIMFHRGKIADSKENLRKLIGVKEGEKE